MITSCGKSGDPAAMSLCDLSMDFGAYSNKRIVVRGGYYAGLRDASCPQRCGSDPWPSFTDLTNNEAAGWSALVKAMKTVEREAKKSKRFEIWVIVIGRLKSQAHHSPLGPCDRQGSGHFGYGHLGPYPAELLAERFLDVEVTENPKSPYDYAKLYKGAL